MIVQDHPLLASAIARVLESQEDLSVCAIARSGDDAARLAAKERPSVVLMDFQLPDSSGPVAAARIQSVVPGAAIVFHSADESEAALLDAIDAGATAYLTKAATADEIIEAVRQASIGELLIPVALFAKAFARQRKVITDAKARQKLFAQFTPRELEVLRLLASGEDNARIAAQLHISPKTVKNHISNILMKLQIENRIQAAVFAVRSGLA